MENLCKILANRKIKALFCRILLCMTGFSLLSAALIRLGPKRTALYIVVSALLMGFLILTVCYGYFKEQDEIMERAVEQIREYISGSKEARIECQEEGELYRLFHEVNTLASILNAHTEKEGEEKEFLRNTISDISHQLKTPLAALNIYNGILQGEAENLPTVREFTDLSEQELERIETLVMNLLKISKFDSGTIMLEKAPENVSEMMERIKKHFSFRAGQEGKEIILSGDESTDFACDRNWLMEAVINIVKNALDHTERGDSVRIEWKTSASSIQIAVIDNGSGIHPEDLYYIFKRFYRSRYSKDTQGIGLGLPLAKSIIEAHGGSITADSDLGRGTAFYIYFHDHSYKTVG